MIHNGDKHFDLMGNASHVTGFSLQTNKPDFRNVHKMTLQYLQKSAASGKPWVVACDEPGDATHALIPDNEDSTHDNARKNALRGNIMAGGAGVEWYFGYKHAHSDLTCQDFRVRQNMWQQCRIALEFFNENEIPFWEMANANQRLSNKDSYCLAQPGKLYLCYLQNGAASELDLSDTSGEYRVSWFNPRQGGKPKAGTIESVLGGSKVSLGHPPIKARRVILSCVVQPKVLVSVLVSNTSSEMHCLLFNAGIVWNHSHRMG